MTTQPFIIIAFYKCVLCFLFSHPCVTGYPFAPSYITIAMCHIEAMDVGETSNKTHKGERSPEQRFFSPSLGVPGVPTCVRVSDRSETCCCLFCALAFSGGVHFVP